MVQIGRRIKEMREKRGLSQGDVERATGMLRAYVSRVEHGHTTPSVETLERFAAALQVPMHELFRDISLVAGETPGDDEFSMLGPLFAYVRQMSSENRKILLTLAQRLAK